MPGVQMVSSGGGGSVGAWTALTLPASVGDSPGSFGAATQGARLEEGIVRLRGILATISEIAENGEVFKLPEAAFFPVTARVLTTTFGLAGALTPIRLVVQATGVCKVSGIAAPLATGKTISLDDLSFPLK